MQKDVTVADLLEILNRIEDKNKPIMVKKYSCGKTFYETLSDSELKIDDNQTLILLMDFN
jgi:hypothetical protein